MQTHSESPPRRPHLRRSLVLIATYLALMILIACAYS